MASLTDWVNNNIGDPKRKFISPIAGIYNTFSNANTSNAGLVVPGMKGLEKGVTPYTNKTVLPPKPKQPKLASMPKTDNTIKKDTGKGLGKNKVSSSLAPLEAAAAQIAPTAVQGVSTEVPLGMEGLSARMPYEVGNSDMFADTNSYLDTRGITGEVALPKEQYTNLAGDGTVGLAGTPTSSNWVDGLSNFETAQAGLGLFNTGFNLYDNLWGGGAELRDKQMGLLDTQIADAQYNLKNKQGFDQSVRNTFGKKGLA